MAKFLCGKSHYWFSYSFILCASGTDSANLNAL
jgi:hypothetical protein